MRQQPTRGEIVTIAGGAVTVLSSFLAFYSFSSAVGDLSVNAWDSGLFPIATYPAFAGLLSEKNPAYPFLMTMTMLALGVLIVYRLRRAAPLQGNRRLFAE